MWEWRNRKHRVRKVLELFFFCILNLYFPMGTELLPLKSLLPIPYFEITRFVEPRMECRQLFWREFIFQEYHRVGELVFGTTSKCPNCWNFQTGMLVEMTK